MTKDTTMTTNVERARRWFKDVWVAGGESVVDELMAENVEASQEGGDITRREQFVEVRRQLFNAFPDLAVVVEDTVAEGAKVVVRWSVEATHAGDGLGIPATNRRVSFRGMTWLEFSEGRIVRGWDSWNLGKLLQSLGSAP
jgi:steroid delta-isomerase-like uncharacterized protein